jgi:hypothetical protein
MRRNLFYTIVVIALLIGVIGALLFLSKRAEQSPTAGPGDLAAIVAKPKPVTDYFEGCPPSGDGGDPVLNTLKNRIDEGVWASTTISALLALTWPEAIENQPRSRWSAADKEAVALYEGSPVQVEGYLVEAKKMSPESCNCHSTKYVDFHIWMTDDPNKSRAQSVVIEIAPRVLVHHPEWTIRRLGEIARNKEKVRISGWLLMDPEHPDQIGKTRGTIWEIHPIMQIETHSLTGWKPLDNGSTGVSSAPAVAQTVPPVTPVEAATQPPTGNKDVQDNTSVQIGTIFFDGKKSREPDEFVEIINKGGEPVDITDWELQDTIGNTEYKWESYILQPGATVRVYTNETHSESGGFSFGSGSPIWNNSGDIAELYDSDKQLVSRYAYGNKK